MAGTTSRPPAAGSVTALSVHGPAGVVDLTVPIEATFADVARAYAAEARLPAPLPLVDRAGRPVQMTDRIDEAGLVAGAVVVAIDPSSRPAPPRRRGPQQDRPTPVAGSASATWLSVAVGIAVAAGWFASRLPDDDRWPAVVVLGVAALVACLPVGALAAQRALAAPAFAAAAAFAAAWDPEPERLPAVFGFAALAAAVAAGICRSLAGPDSEAEDGLRVWMAVGAAWFLIAGLGALTSSAPQVVWSALFLLAVLGARFVPEFAVDVPDQYLLDLERLAVTAWSARERPTGRRGRIIVPEHAVGVVASRGARTIRAASIAIFVVAVVAGPALLGSTTSTLDRIGGRCLVGFGGAALLFAARSYRHPLARRFLRLAGVASLGLVAAVLLGVGPAGASSGDPFRPGLVAVLAIAIALLLVLVAVLVGRGWRSAWWSRRAEVGEAIAGSFAVGSLVVAVGLFRFLWELTS